MNVSGLMEKVENRFVNEASHVLVVQQTAIGTYLYSFAVLGRNSKPIYVEQMERGKYDIEIMESAMLKKFWRYIGAA